MGESEAPIITPEQSRAARALLDWSQDQLASKATLSGGTVRHFEKRRQVPSAESLRLLRKALESAGIEFIAENGGGAGVRLAKRAKKARK